MFWEQFHTIERDANFTSISFFELITIYLHRSSMRNEQAMANYPWFCRSISHRALGAIARVTRSKGSRVISQHAATPGLIESDPVFNLGTKCFKDHPGIVCEIGNEFLLIQESTVPLIEFVGKIPMEQCDHWGNPCCDQIIDKLGIELQAFLVDRVVATTERNDAGPILFYQNQ